MMPVFGKSRYFNRWASVNNPQRVGTYVRTVRRTGRLNPGTFYELTDGKGEFWLGDPKRMASVLPVKMEGQRDERREDDQ